MRTDKTAYIARLDKIVKGAVINKWEPVQVKQWFRRKGMDFFLHRAFWSKRDAWTVSEYSCGAAIGSGKTMKAALESANNLIDKRTRKNLKKQADGIACRMPGRKKS